MSICLAHATERVEQSQGVSRSAAQASPKVLSVINKCIIG